MECEKCKEKIETESPRKKCDECDGILLDCFNQKDGRYYYCAFCQEKKE